MARKSRPHRKKRHKARHHKSRRLPAGMTRMRWLRMTQKQKIVYRARASQRPLRRKIENRWWKSMRKKGWRISYGMLTNDRILKKYGRDRKGFRKQLREENAALKRLKSLLAKHNIKHSAWF